MPDIKFASAQRSSAASGPAASPSLKPSPERGVAASAADPEAAQEAAQRDDSRGESAVAVSGVVPESPKEAISTVERIARHLEDGIIFGQLAPSERIQELKVAADLGVSRGSVREALLVLEGRHMVSILPRRGALVRPLNNSEIASIAEVIALVTGTLFTELASRRPAGATLAPLQDGLAAISAAAEAGDIPALVAARQAFFELPLGSIDNDFTGDLLRGLSGSARRLMLLASRNSAFDIGDTRRCAQALYEATASHDGERARQILAAMLRRDATLASG